MAKAKKGMGKEGSPREEKMESKGERAAEAKAGMAYKSKLAKKKGK